MAIRIVTRGLGGSASSLLVQGFLTEEITKIVIGGTRYAKKLLEEIEQSFTISAMLISTNGKELTKPIFNKVAQTFNVAKTLIVKASPKHLVSRKYDKTKVIVEGVKIRNKNNE